MKKSLLFICILICITFSGIHAQDWGASPDGDQTSVLGDWNISEDSIFHNTLIMTTPDPNRLFYRASPKLANYTVKADVRLLEMQTEGAYPKYGFFPAYKNPTNWIWVFLHPMESENGISVVALVDNVWTILWQVYEWGTLNIDYFEDNELRIDKAGNLFKVLVNGTEKASFEAAIDSAWVGLCTDAVRCSYKDFSIVNNDATGVERDRTSVPLSVFPNPAGESLFISSGSTIDEVEIFNLTGQKVSSMKIHSTSTSYNLSSLTDGLYLMKIRTEKGIIVQKIQVRK
jgi:hypothetical protein